MGELFARDRSSRDRRARGLVLAVAVVLVGLPWAKFILRPGTVGDFPLHLNFGRLFVAGSHLYADGHFPYPPAWGLACAPLTLLPGPKAQVFVYPLGVGALAALVILLDRLARRSPPLPDGARFWAAVLALALSSRFLIRELPECGPNFATVALAWAGLACWRARRDAAGGACLGLAIALKCTPALFVPYFALKRQWRMVGASLLFAALFTLAPIARMGPTSYARHLREWAGNCWRGLGESDPSVGVLGQDEVKNHALRPVLARFLMDLPAGHLGRVDSPWRARGLGLPPRLAGLAIKAGMALLLAGVALAFRRPARDRDDPAIPWEGAAVSLLLLLYSPLTWRQHCVAAYPACYLIARSAFARGGPPRWLIAAMATYAVAVLGLDRWVVGRTGTLILDSWGVTTWSLLLLLAVTLACRRASVEAPAADRPRPRPHADAARARRAGLAASIGPR